MIIRVSYLAQLQKVIDKTKEEYSCDNDISVASFIKEVICLRHEVLKKYILDENGETIPVLMVFVGEDQINDINSHMLNNDSEIVLMLPIAGG